MKRAAPIGALLATALVFFGAGPAAACRGRCPDANQPKNPREQSALDDVARFWLWQSQYYLGDSLAWTKGIFAEEKTSAGLENYLGSLEDLLKQAQERFPSDPELIHDLEQEIGDATVRRIEAELKEWGWVSEAPPSPPAPFSPPLDFDIPPITTTPGR